MTSSEGQSKASSSYPPPPFTLSRRYIERKAKILMTHDLTGVSRFITRLCYAKEIEEYSTSNLLYDHFIHDFPDRLALKLLEVYKFKTVSATVRSFCLELLGSLLLDLEESRVGLKKQCLGEFKDHLNDFLYLQETSDHDFKILSSIISCVSVNVFIADLPWKEIRSYITCISDYEYKKPLLMFIDLPMVLHDNFLILLLENDLLGKILDGLLDQDFKNEEEWFLFLEAGFNLAIQLSNLQRSALVCDLVYAIVKSVCDMVKVKRREIVVRKGLVKLVKKVRREAWRFREGEYEVVTRLVSMIKGIDEVGEVTKMAADMILEVLEKNYMGGKRMNLSFNLNQLVIG